MVVWIVYTLICQSFSVKKEQVIDMICHDVTYCHIKLFETILN
jgi:hypothetical protein